MWGKNDETKRKIYIDDQTNKYGDIKTDRQEKEIKSIIVTRK